MICDRYVEIKMCVVEGRARMLSVTSAEVDQIEKERELLHLRYVYGIIVDMKTKKLDHHIYTVENIRTTIQ